MADLTERATGQNDKVEKKLLEKYPPIFSPTIYQTKSFTVEDDDSNLMLWYIPGSLTIKRVVSSFFTCSFQG